MECLIIIGSFFAVFFFFRFDDHDIIVTKWVAKPRLTGMSHVLAMRNLFVFITSQNRNNNKQLGMINVHESERLQSRWW